MWLFLFTLFWVSDSLTLAFLIKFGKLLAGIYLNFFSPPQSLFLSFCDSNRTWAGLPPVTPQVTEALFTFTVIFFAFCASVRSYPVACPLGHWFFVWITAPLRAFMNRDLPPPGMGALFGPLRRFCGSGFPVSSPPRIPSSPRSFIAQVCLPAPTCSAWGAFCSPFLLLAVGLSAAVSPAV